MERIWFTSDLHLCHKNILKFEAENRKFDTVDEMHEEIIRRWNAVVEDDDLVYILGDVSFGKVTKTSELLGQLNGRKRLLRGNHDTLVNHHNFVKHFEWIKDYYEMKLEDGRSIVLMHYPIQEWNGRMNGCLHFYGHVHDDHRGQRQHIPGSFHVGMDTNNLTPVLLEDAIKQVEKGEIRR